MESWASLPLVLSVGKDSQNCSAFTYEILMSKIRQAYSRCANRS